MRSARPSRPHSDASWSSSPVSAPTQSFSIRLQSRASSIRSPLGRLARQLDAARARAPPRARPRRRGRCPARSCRAIVSARARQRDAERAQLADRAADERPPAVGRLRVAGGEPVALARGRSRGASIWPPVSGSAAHGDPVGDRERQREAVVVVGVLADQVDPPGRERGDALQSPRREPALGRAVDGEDQPAR